MGRTPSNGGPRKSGKDATAECRKRKKEKLEALQKTLQKLQQENQQYEKLIANRQRIIEFMQEASQRAAEAKRINGNQANY